MIVGVAMLLIVLSWFSTRIQAIDGAGSMRDDKRKQCGTGQYANAVEHAGRNTLLAQQ
jgi:hypothetical protein